MARMHALEAWLNDSDDPHWQRPAPTAAQQRNDIGGTLCFMLIGLLVNTIMLSAGIASGSDEPLWRTYVAVAVMILPLAFRRRAPLLTVLISSVIFVSMSYFAPAVAPQPEFQVAYFAALYTAVAWARDRRMLWFAMGLVLLAMMLWVAILVTQLHAQALVGDVDASGTRGPLPHALAAAAYVVLINVAYFGGAILIGRTSWRGALQRDRSDRHAGRIAEQADELARNAVLDERMRIARELHDVVAHHVSAIGIQAAAARTVLTTDTDTAAGALREIEGSSRDAVGEMRNLLGVLRSDTQDTDAPDRAPEPGLDQLDELVADYRETGLDVSLSRVENSAGDLTRIAPPLGLTAYRIAQESLANVRRHSTARAVQVTVRTGSSGADDEWLEIEVVDDGRARTGTRGTGYGLQGVQERVNLLNGTHEAGERTMSPGWRVRARLPLQENV